MDDIHRWCPIGFVGEICIGGGGLAQGYLNRKELSEAKFIKEPYTELLSISDQEMLTVQLF